MDRLTERLEDGTVTDVKRDTGDFVSISEMLNRLADYEDIGLTPYDIARILASSENSHIEQEVCIENLQSQLRQEREKRMQAEKALELACLDIEHLTDSATHTNAYEIQNRVQMLLAEAKEILEEGTASNR